LAGLRALAISHLHVARDLTVPRRDFFGRDAWAGFSGQVDAGGTVMANPFEFIQQVRAEATKVTWPTRRETLITTGLVLLMVVVASIFFVSVDQAIRLALTFIMSLGH
jgi:preprotein translocase subunit SecE